jgi:hypothetical protein
MPTTSQQLDDFASTVEAAVVWTPDIQGQLMGLIREPAFTILSQTIPANDRTKAMDNIYRCKPRGWVRAEQELEGGGSVASFSHWSQSPGVSYVGLDSEVGTLKICNTLALAMVAATARVWSHILKQAGR